MKVTVVAVTLRCGDSYSSARALKRRSPGCYLSCRNMVLTVWSFIAPHFFLSYFSLARQFCLIYFPPVSFLSLFPHLSSLTLSLIPPASSADLCRLQVPAMPRPESGQRDSNFLHRHHWPIWLPTAGAAGKLTPPAKNRTYKRILHNPASIFW